MPKRTVLLLLILALLTTACSSSPPPGLMGAYRFADGRVISVRPSIDETLRYREYRTGNSGRLHRQASLLYVSGPGFSDREPVALTVQFDLDDDGVANTLSWTSTGGEPDSARRIGRDRWVEFESEGARLTGRLHLPDGPGPHPAIVLVHGSGDSPGSEWFYNGDFFVANGFAVLAFDKRGTGRSEGEYTFDFYQLARDVVAAVRFLRSQPEVHAGRIGLSGYSQGAWVAPLAASEVDVGFILVSYGMIESPAQEARLEMLHLLRQGGVVSTELQEADSLVTAAVAVVASEFKAGWDRFGTLKKRYKDAPWRRYLEGTPVDQLMKYPRWLVKILGPGKLPRDLPWYYDSTALLDTLNVPMTWLLAGQDESAPNELTIPKLRELGDAGLPYALVVFPDADHGMLVFREEGDQRTYTGYAPGYYQAEVGAALRWISEAETSSNDSSGP